MNSLKIDTFLRQTEPIQTESLFTATKSVQTIERDRSITRADLLVEPFQLGLRQIQRLFREYVGVRPKWVIRRYRPTEAAEPIRRGSEAIDFVGLEIDLGYSDQAHFIRDFKQMVGVSPVRYLKSLERYGRG